MGTRVVAKENAWQLKRKWSRQKEGCRHWGRYGCFPPFHADHQSKSSQQWPLTQPANFPGSQRLATTLGCCPRGPL